MELFTGKNKTNFEEWYKLQGELSYTFSSSATLSLPIELKKGVIERYYDEKLIDIDIDRDDIDEYNLGIYFHQETYGDLKAIELDDFKSRIEAFKAACIELDKIMNKEL